MPRTPTQDPRPRPPAIPTADAPLTPSKSHRKRDTHAFQVLGVQFVALSAAQLTRLALPKALHEAVVAAQRMRSHGAHPRQMQPIGKLMRQLEPAALSRIRAALTPGRADGEGLEPDHGGVTSRWVGARRVALRHVSSRPPFRTVLEAFTSHGSALSDQPWS